MPDLFTFLLKCWICYFLLETTKRNAVLGCSRMLRRKCSTLGLPPLDIEILKHSLDYARRLEGVTDTGSPEAVTDCGRRLMDLNALVGGSTSAKMSWPWFALVISPGGNENDTTFCGGTLIHRQWVLTAGHCIQSEVVQVFVGVTNVLHIDEANLHLSSLFIPYDDYDPSSNRTANDITLIKLQSPVVFSREVFPVCLPTPQLGSFLDAENCYVIGFGKTVSTVFASSSMPLSLQQLRVNVYENADCDSSIKGLVGEANQEKYLCAKSKKSFASTCDGDAGSPLTCLKEGTYYVAGILSFEDEICLGISPDIFVRVAAFTAWIEKKMEDNL